MQMYQVRQVRQVRLVHPLHRLCHLQAQWVMLGSDSMGIVPWDEGSLSAREEKQPIIKRITRIAGSMIFSFCFISLNLICVFGLPFVPSLTVSARQLRGGRLLMETVQTAAAYIRIGIRHKNTSNNVYINIIPHWV